MLRRSETPSLRTFVRSVIQGETLGVSTGQIMRNLALEMRKRRRAMAEERAQKAPMKMLFPLIFLIFPAMFVVLLGPAVYSTRQDLRRSDDGPPRRSPRPATGGRRHVLCEHCVLADTLWRRMRGLLGRRELYRGDGIVLRPVWSVHTFFMRFPIDVVFLDADQVVSRSSRPHARGELATCRGARDVVELAQESAGGAAVTAGAAAGVGRPAGTATRAAAPTRRPPPCAWTRRPTRVLLGTEDDHFLRSRASC